jgi:hypothetical protein
VYAAAVFPIYGWAILRFFGRMRGWLIHLNIWDVIGIFSYVMLFAWIESLLVLIVLILLSAILPAGFLRERFVAQSSLAVFLTSGWAIVAHYKAGVGEILPWTLKTFLLGAALYLVSIGVSHFLLRFFEPLEDSVNSFAERLTVFLYVYLPMTLLAVVIIILRNI